MLRRLALRDFVIVESLEVELTHGFSVLTGETGAGKSILIDALQLALGGRAEVGVVREGAPRAEITAEFDTPQALKDWLDTGGFDAVDSLLIKRVIDAQGKSRAWINGSAATLAQLREASEALVEIHGQHAWQSLTRPAAVRALLDEHAGVDAITLQQSWSQWRASIDTLEAARTRQTDIERERERLAWQITEVDKLAPRADEWQELNAEHQRLSNAQSLIDAARGALDALADADVNATLLTGRAIGSLDDVARFDTRLADVIDVLRSAQAQLEDAGHTLAGYLNHADLDPQRLAEFDNRMGTWMSLARRWRRPPAELPALLAQWKSELRALDAASDLAGLSRAVDSARAAYDRLAQAACAARTRSAPSLAANVTQAMQQLGMAGGRFDIALLPQEMPQSYGSESAEFLVAGHTGSTPRPLGKVASGGELSRIALALAVTTAQANSSTPSSERTLPVAATLIFDEIDAGVGGAVAESVGRLMKQLGRSAQVLAVTHLPQVAACADQHFVVSKATRALHGHELTLSDIQPVAGETRVAEIARMLGGERLSGTSLAHAQEMLDNGRTHARSANEAPQLAETAKPAAKRRRTPDKT